MQATLDIEYSRSSVAFAWTGFDEGDEISGEGSAELLDDGFIEIEFEYHNGDDAVFKAKREPFFNSLLRVGLEMISFWLKRLRCAA
jgi:hypothetical protein